MSVLLNTTLAHKASLPNLRYIDIGGGIGTPYKPSDKAVDIDVLGQSVCAAFSRFQAAFCEGTPATAALQLIVEPGRFIVAESGMLITRVNTLKMNAGRCFAGIDTGGFNVGRRIAWLAL